LGLIVEEPDLPEGVKEFCSTWFYPWGQAVPQTWARSMFRLLAHRPDPDLLQQFYYEMRGHPDRELMVAVVRESWILGNPSLTGREIALLDECLGGGAGSAQSGEP
jgi:hypothetical protein